MSIASEGGPGASERWAGDVLGRNQGLRYIGRGSADFGFTADPGVVLG